MNDVFSKQPIGTDNDDRNSNQLLKIGNLAKTAQFFE